MDATVEGEGDSEVEDNGAWDEGADPDADTTNSDDQPW